MLCSRFTAGPNCVIRFLIWWRRMSIGSARDDLGREGMDYWQILVLASVRLGCNLDYDKLQNLAEEHRALRQIMGIGDW